eukprot:scaffold235733_cov21-Tisochrysis_lutea.AAC.1
MSSTPDPGIAPSRERRRDGPLARGRDGRGPGHPDTTAPVGGDTTLVTTENDGRVPEDAGDKLEETRAGLLTTHKRQTTHPT